MLQVALQIVALTVVEKTCWVLCFYDKTPVSHVPIRVSINVSMNVKAIFDTLYAKWQ